MQTIHIREMKYHYSSNMNIDIIYNNIQISIELG
jgi:hypothetical protein